MSDKTTTPAGLLKMREPFAPNQIGKLPKESKKQREEREQNRNLGFNCPICKGWHHKNAVHLDYVGHAAATDRLLDADPSWNWEPVAWTDQGEPKFDPIGGMWIRLTVCGVTRLGYGNADKKAMADAGSREKEVIGDAIRNAAMRFGAGLEMWHKGDLHGPDVPPDPEGDPPFDGHPADVRERQDATPPPPPASRNGELAPYPKDRFEADFPSWKAAVEAGTKTAAQVLAMVGTKGTLNPVQKAKIEALRKAK
jgi:hypothetical protein